MYYCKMIIRRRNTFFPLLVWTIGRQAKILKGRTPFLFLDTWKHTPSYSLVSCEKEEKWSTVSIVVSRGKISRKIVSQIFPLDKESCARWYLIPSIYRSAKVFTVSATRFKARPQYLSMIFWNRSSTPDFAVVYRSRVYRDPAK